MNILGIDPGNTKSAYVVYNTNEKIILEKGLIPNEELLDTLKYLCVVDDIHVYIEMVASYGMTVGKEVFDTCVWIGRFTQKLYDEGVTEVASVYRKEVKLILCNSLRAKDKHIHRACLDRLGKEKTKGIVHDMWSALAICLTVESMNNLEEWKTLKEKLP